ncbi:MAG: hypothetical protein AAFQ90_04450 [Pseudomonadota bacterium]
MDSFLLCLLLVAGTSLGARDQIIVAQLSDAMAVGKGDDIRRPIPLLAIGLVCAAVTAGLMAYGATLIANLLPRRAALMLVSFALAIAAFELAWPVRLKPMREPTQSAPAIAVVLLWRQMGDAARFAIFAFAAAATYPVTAWLGGALGGAAAVVFGWMLGLKVLTRWPLVWVRRSMAVALIIAALFIGLNARYAVL